MKIKIKKSISGNLKTSKMFADSLHKFYNFETDEHGDFLITNSEIRLLRDLKIKDKEEIHRAWELLSLIRECVVDSNSIYNFNFYIEDGHIEINLGNDCAYIKNHLQYYEDYLRRLEREGIESYIEFELEENNLKDDFQRTTK